MSNSSIVPFITAIHLHYLLSSMACLVLANGTMNIDDYLLRHCHDHLG